MNRAWIVAGLMTVVVGCTSAPESDEIIPIEQVPAPILDVARRELPGYTLDTVYQMKVEGKVAYEIKGKDKRGKVREVEISSTGEVLAIE